MKKARLARLALSACMFFLLSLALVFAGEPVMIGQGSPKPEANNKLGNGYIYITDAGKNAAAFRISTQGSSIYVAKVKVFFEDGSSKEVGVGRTYAVEEDVQKTPLITIGPHDSPLEKVMVRFRSRRNAAITLWQG